VCVPGDSAYEGFCHMPGNSARKDSAVYALGDSACQELWFVCLGVFSIMLGEELRPAVCTGCDFV